MSNTARRFIKNDRKSITRKRGIRYSCPNCHRGFRLRKPAYVVKNGDLSGTAGCPHCSSLLHIENNRANDFHTYMHKLNAQWPIDGKNTYSIKI